MINVTATGWVQKAPIQFTTKNGVLGCWGLLSVKHAYIPVDPNENKYWLLLFKAWGKTATSVHQYFKKGDHVLLNGILEVNKSESGESKINITIRDFESIRKADPMSITVDEEPRKAEKIQDESFDDECPF